MRPDFGVDCVFVVTMQFFSWQAAVGGVFLDVVLDLIEMLAGVVRRVLFRRGEGAGGVYGGGAGALLATMADAPQEH